VSPECGWGRFFPTRSTDRTHHPLSTPFSSKSSRVVIFTISGCDWTLRSASDSHILSHVLLWSGWETPANVAIILSLVNDDAASIYVVRLCMLHLGDVVFLLLMPSSIFFILVSSVHMLPLSAVMSWWICIIWYLNLDRWFVTVLILSSIFVCSILYISCSLSISANFLLRFDSPDIVHSFGSWLLLARVGVNVGHGCLALSCWWIWCIWCCCGSGLALHSLHCMSVRYTSPCCMLWFRLL
jgi:hypothetical protein